MCFLHTLYSHSLLYCNFSLTQVCQFQEKLRKPSYSVLWTPLHLHPWYYRLAYKDQKHKRYCEQTSVMDFMFILLRIDSSSIASSGLKGMRSLLFSSSSNFWKSCLLGWREPHGLFFADSCVNYRHSGRSHLHLILKSYKIFIKMLSCYSTKMFRILMPYQIPAGSMIGGSVEVWAKSILCKLKEGQTRFSMQEVLEWVWPSMHLMK